jgi:ferredoxin
MCEEQAPKAFKEGQVLDSWKEEWKENIKKAKDCCPMMAIEFEEI